MSAQGSFIADDGVRIGYRQGGSGPPLLLVHGGATDHRCFETIRGRLESEFTVTAYDRRGRGMSGDHPEYSLGREAADFVQAAEVAGGGEPVAVIAYSFGATVALHAVSTRAARVRALVAYEAPANAPSMIPAEQDILALIAAGRHDAAVRLFVRSTFLLPDPVVEAMAAHPMWQVSLAAVPTLPREAAALRTMAIAPPTVDRKSVV